MTRQVAVRLPDDLVAAIDEAVASGHFKNRSAAIIEAIRIAVRDRREAAIGEMYRRAYAEQPITADEGTWLESAARASLDALDAEESA